MTASQYSHYLAHINNTYHKRDLRTKTKGSKNQHLIMTLSWSNFISLYNLISKFGLLYQTYIWKSLDQEYSCHTPTYKESYEFQNNIHSEKKNVFTKQILVLWLKIKNKIYIFSLMIHNFCILIGHLWKRMEITFEFWFNRECYACNYHSHWWEKFKNLIWSQIIIEKV